MEPAFYRGDLLFLVDLPDTKGFPIVHRVLETYDVVKAVKGVHEKVWRPENQLLLSKDDNNYLGDVELYQGFGWLERKHIVGKVRRFLPYVGYVTITLPKNDFSQLKYALLGGLGLLTLVQRE
ncbi:hypothetical protein BC834DRAFT_840636 [Gloeopeniophorella convolvens]|nr:hypothetical protein BC834DRAFT_840636 [Gloeopeniophorella convolvens]